MQILLYISSIIDRVVAFVARIGSWACVLLVLVVCYDVITRHFGVAKPFGLNSTQVQESEYWLHAFLFALLIGYTYTRQAHVRIDLVREALGTRTKYLIETLGCLLFLVPYAIVGFYLSIDYVATSFEQGEVSKSVIGLSNIWILKGSLLPLYGLLGLAGLSQLIKSIAGLTGQLPEHLVVETLAGDR